MSQHPIHTVWGVVWDMQKKYKAATALGASITGFILSYAYADTGFAGGIINSGFLAATIGGLADWFAVTAIFRKPLGISYHTQILTHNRERIMNSIVDFASKDLLSTQNIMEIVRQQNMAQMLVDYLSIRGGRERLKTVIDQLLLQAAHEMDTQAIAVRISPAIKGSLKSFPIEKLLLQLPEILAEERYSTRVIETIVSVGRSVFMSTEAQEILLFHISALRQRYEENSPGRSLALQLLDLSDERMRNEVNKKVCAYLDDLQSHETESYAKIKADMETLLLKCSRDASLEALLHTWKCERIEKMNIAETLASWLERVIKAENPAWLEAVHRFADAKINAFAAKEGMQKRYDVFVKSYIEKEIHVHHDIITNLIRERLDEFSDEKLVAFVETRIADDLQMIRINGSLIGSFVGMLLFAVVFCAERAWG